MRDQHNCPVISRVSKSACARGTAITLSRSQSSHWVTTLFTSRLASQASSSLARFCHLATERQVAIAVAFGGKADIEIADLDVSF